MSIAVKDSEEFVFSPENLAWTEGQLKKYPKNRQMSCVMPFLQRAQEQNHGWVSIPIMEYIADFLDMPYIRVHEVASFYSMYNLKPVGKCFLQACTTTPCMLRGSDDMVRCIKDKLDISSGQTSECGRFTMLEVECLGACVNAPILQVNDDFYEDLDYQSTAALIESLAADTPPPIGSVIGRQGSESEAGATTLVKEKKTAKAGK